MSIPLVSDLSSPKAFQKICDVHKKFTSHPVVQRFTSNWKTLLMDAATIIAITGFALSLLASAFLTSGLFLFFATASGVGAFYMRRFATFKTLEATVAELQATQRRFQTIAEDLERENARLSRTSQELQETNAALQRTNADFQETHRNLQQTNTNLTQQVTRLTLQVTQLGESAKRIRVEMDRFQRENGNLTRNNANFSRSVQLLDQEILTSRSLCEQISNHLTAQQATLGVQLRQLGEYLTELRAENRILERIREVNALHQQIREATDQLSTLRVQYAQERAHFQSVHAALVQLRNQFDASIRSAIQDFGQNNQRLRGTAESLDRQLGRLDQMLNQRPTALRV